MTIVYDPSLDMESQKPKERGGGTQFMPPEHQVPHRFGLERLTPSKEADIYAMGMVIYQVRTAQCLTHAFTDFPCVGTHWSTTVW